MDNKCHFNYQPGGKSINHQRAGKRKKRRGRKSIPIYHIVIGDGRRLPLDRVTDQLLNDPSRDNPNSEHDENDDQFMKTVVPPNLDVDMVENYCSIGIEGNNHVDVMEQISDRFFELRISNSHKKCNAGLQKLKNYNCLLEFNSKFKDRKIIKKHNRNNIFIF